MLSKEIVGYLTLYGKLPEGFTKGWSPELLAQADKLTRVSAVIGVIGAQAKTHAEGILNRAIPGGLDDLKQNVLQPYIDAGGKDIYGKIDEWMTKNNAALEEAAMDEMDQIASEIVIDQPGIPTIEYAAQLNEATRNAWIQRVLSYYKGIGIARDYAMLVQLLQMLGSERSNAGSQEDLAWIDGLIGSAETWITTVANEQGVHPELGVQRAEDAFQTEMKVGAE